MANLGKHSPFVLTCRPLRKASMLVLFFAFSLVTAAWAQTFTVLHEFTGGQDGENPQSGLAIHSVVPIRRLVLLSAMRIEDKNIPRF